MTVAKLDLALEAFEAALPYLRQVLPPDELSAWIELHSREILADTRDALEHAYASGRIERMLGDLASTAPGEGARTGGAGAGMHT